MRVTVREIVEQDSFETQHGTLFGIKFVADGEDGEMHWLGVNAKKPDAIRPGDSFNFLASGKMAGKWTLGKREQGTLGQGSGGGSAPRQNAPHSAPQAAHGASAKPVPTMSQAVAVLRECIEAVKGIEGSDGHATTLFLARLRGDIRRDPSPAEVEAEKAKAAAAAEAARIEAERAAEAARKAAEEAAARAPGYTPSDGSDDLIPF